MSEKPQRINKSAGKVFKVLDVLERNFVHGFSPSEIAAETGLSLSDINSYVNTLIEADRAERIQETSRIRISHRSARVALQIMNSLDEAERQIQQSKTRITRG